MRNTDIVRVFAAPATLMQSKLRGIPRSEAIGTMMCDGFFLALASSRVAYCAGKPLLCHRFVVTASCAAHCCRYKIHNNDNSKQTLTYPVTRAAAIDDLINYSRVVR